MRRASLDPLVVGRVVGDVLDIFIPTAEMVVRYGGKKISINGGKVKPSSAAERPKLCITGSPNNYYTLVMVDPDAPSPSEPSFREWLQWLVIDIPEGCDASEGKELMEYMGPQPPIGIHRHVFAAFRQQGLMETVKGRPVERGLFNTRHFATENQLGLPVAALYFNSQKQPLGNKKR
ncbi:PEBP family protein [Perilla frutescens var. hirtella]|uniref:PEBP family protein n=1 Tax=Perilla frutescens var. hirtella TaxID=608512 RepID=A0AAD4J9D3_PERFH|nr:PEBP family protein [Perilla frutescens var. frutescens]KAH6790529.1 PEBP family protein [Perilla frutescens var. frutescens]KAH6792855.1 PEBP family protein [Perilla frutescens var. hirtella]KAH6829005.1 PEBP family protein [Perilla frutescens var. hirtella]